MKLFLNSLGLVVSLAFLSGCGVYKQNIMFQLKEQKPTELTESLLTAERNYTIQINDILKLNVFSNNGERIIDPNRDLARAQGSTAASAQNNFVPTYQVNVDGEIKVPMIGLIKVTDMTLREAELLLQKEYNKFYKDCFVSLVYDSKRVVLLGAVGGQVIPLHYDNMKLTEVLALSKGIGMDGKAHNIRLIRGEEVYLIDFSTVAGLQAGNMVMVPGDVVYVEPLRRPFIEGFRDVSTISGFIISLGTLVLLIVNLSQNSNN